MRVNRIRHLKDLARIHQPVRIESSLDASHDVQGIRAKLLYQRLFLAKAYPMLTLPLLLALHVAARTEVETNRASPFHL